MWSPTKATPTSSSSLSSDNKNIREEVDDCRCSNIETIVDVDLTITPQQQQQQQQIIKLNNKQQTFGSVGAQSSYVGQQAGGQQERKFVKSEEDEQEEESDCKHFTESATDSGFISGPQQIDISSSANILNDHSTKIKRNSAGAVEQYNITTTALSRKAQKQQKEQEQKEEEDENLIFDSGCIAEVEDSAEIEPKSVTTSNASTTTTESASNDSQMLIKHNVDAGMAEWFCNLSLQTDGTQTADNTSRLGINNLNALQRQRTTAQQQQQQQQQNLTTGNSIITPTVPTITMTPSSAWEQFYQQNDDGDTPLHLACISGSVDVVAALICMAPHPCLLNIQNDDCQTPLHLAALTAQPKILRMLLIAGAEPTIRNRNGNTALHLACISGEEQCVRALIIPISPSEINEARNQYGNRANDKTYLSCARLPSDLEIRNYDGERCVHLTAQLGYIDILRLLVLYGADINAREGKSGRTPLHIAIEAYNESLFNYLLDECQKLNLETETYAGLTAYQVACLLNKSTLQTMLKTRGAEPLTPPDSEYDGSDVESDLEEAKFVDRFGDPGYFANFKGGNAMTVA